MKEAVEELRQSETLLAWVGMARADVIGWRLVTVGVGTAVTLLVQSSSATMAITMTLAAQGIITLETACALVIGENIGTTVTANLAAIEASTSAKRAARAHFIFNIFGAVWAVVLFAPFFKFIDLITPGHAAGAGAGLSQAAIAARLAMFHSTFNIINTCLFLPFTNQLAWVASELTRMLEEADSMLQRVMMLISSPDKKLGKVAEAVAASEEIVDNLEKEITAYLVEVSRLEVSDRQSREIAGIINAAHDIERIGDHCEVLLRLLRRAYDEKRQFSEAAIGEAMEIGELVQRFIALIKKNVSELSPALMEDAHGLEDSIDEKRKLMRAEHIGRLREGKCEVEQGLIFIDMLTSFEKIGDHAFNIAEVLAGQKQKLLPQEH
jgi:phosphate:Na+ symporter